MKISSELLPVGSKETCGLRFRVKSLPHWGGKLSFQTLNASVTGCLQTVMRIPNKIIWVKGKLCECMWLTDVSQWDPIPSSQDAAATLRNEAISLMEASEGWHLAPIHQSPVHHTIMVEPAELKSNHSPWIVWLRRATTQRRGSDPLLLLPVGFPEAGVVFWSQAAPARGPDTTEWIIKNGLFFSFSLAVSFIFTRRPTFPNFNWNDVLLAHLAKATVTNCSSLVLWRTRRLRAST